MLSGFISPINSLRQNPLHGCALGEIPVKTIRPSRGGFLCGQAPTGTCQEMATTRDSVFSLSGDSQLQRVTEVQDKHLEPQPAMNSLHGSHSGRLDTPIIIH